MLEVSSQSPGSLTFKWTPVHIQSQGACITEYTIYLSKGKSCGVNSKLKTPIPCKDQCQNSFDVITKHFKCVNPKVWTDKDISDSMSAYPIYTVTRSGLEHDYKYHVRISASNANGEGPCSKVESCVTKKNNNAQYAAGAVGSGILVAIMAVLMTQRNRIKKCLWPPVPKPRIMLYEESFLKLSNGAGQSSGSNERAELREMKIICSKSDPESSASSLLTLITDRSRSNSGNGRVVSSSSTCGADKLETQPFNLQIVDEPTQELGGFLVPMEEQATSTKCYDSESAAETDERNGTSVNDEEIPFVESTDADGTDAENEPRMDNYTNVKEALMQNNLQSNSFQEKELMLTNAAVTTDDGVLQEKISDYVLSFEQSEKNKHLEMQEQEKQRSDPFFKNGVVT